jgi:hypothetical protein
MTAFFWIMCLAHLLGDYPLQTDRLAAAKKTWSGLSVHVAIHLALLVILVGDAIKVLWPYLLTLASIHFAIDAFKNRMNIVRPQSLVGFYLFDQFLHLLSLIGVALWAWMNGALVGLADDYLLTKNWAIFGCGLVFVTFMWGISERIFFHRQTDFVAEAIAQKWPRLVMRGTLYFLIVFVGLRTMAPPPVMAAAVVLPYVSGVYRCQALVSDMVIALLTAGTVLVLLA